MSTPVFNAAMCEHIRRPVIVFPAWHPGRAVFRHNDFHVGSYDDVLAVAEQLAAQRAACVRPENAVLPAGWTLSH